MSGDGDGGCIAGEAKKQPSLRPMRECIQRIMYGGDLSSRDFVIGYRDRFRAVPCEAPFDAPNESISGGERSLVQALPEHRIEYLKYRKRLVWHKEQRLDNMFGGQEASPFGRSSTLMKPGSATGGGESSVREIVPLTHLEEA